MAMKSGLKPVARSDARLFILGSLPGDTSLQEQRYYAHPRNGFWKLVGATIGEDLQTLDYDRRLLRLMEHRIGLWDVVGRARRQGSLDQAIRNAAHNPLAEYFSEFANLRAVAFNGAAAAASGRRLLGATRVTLIDLPSSSPANTRPFAEKARPWGELAQFCGA